MSATTTTATTIAPGDARRVSDLLSTVVLIGEVVITSVPTTAVDTKVHVFAVYSFGTSDGATTHIPTVTICIRYSALLQLSRIHVAISHRMSHPYPRHLTFPNLVLRRALVASDTSAAITTLTIYTRAGPDFSFQEIRMVPLDLAAERLRPAGHVYTEFIDQITAVRSAWAKTIIDPSSLQLLARRLQQNAGFLQMISPARVPQLPPIQEILQMPTVTCTLTLSGVYSDPAFDVAANFFARNSGPAYKRGNDDDDDTSDDDDDDDGDETVTHSGTAYDFFKKLASGQVVLPKRARSKVDLRKRQSKRMHLGRKVEGNADTVPHPTTVHTSVLPTIDASTTRHGPTTTTTTTTTTATRENPVVKAMRLEIEHLESTLCAARAKTSVAENKIKEFQERENKYHATVNAQVDELSGNLIETESTLKQIRNELAVALAERDKMVEKMETTAENLKTKHADQIHQDGTSLRATIATQHDVIVRGEERLVACQRRLAEVEAEFRFAGHQATSPFLHPAQFQQWAAPPFYPHYGYQQPPAPVPMVQTGSGDSSSSSSSSSTKE